MQIAICRLYETYPDAVVVVESLREAGVPDEDISLISNNSDNWFDANAARADEQGKTSGQAAKSSEAKSAAGSASPQGDASSERIEGGILGAAVGATAGVAASLLGGAIALATLAVPGLGPAVGVGWLLALVGAGAAVGGATGGIIGALTSAGVDEADAHVYAEGVRRGGSLVAARVPPEDAKRVEEVMEPRAVDIDERAADYRRSGWQSFNPEAPAYSADEVRSERELHRAA
jgi:hypothetical protein